MDGGYYRTTACNLKSVYWGIGTGGFIGTEYVRHPDKEYNFIIGPKLETELEVFILPRTALLARIQQHWNPLSIDKWNNCLERRNKDTALLTDKSYHHAYYHIVSRYKCIRPDLLIP